VTFRSPLALDKTFALDISGSRQRLRLCAARPALRPILIVQGGPGLPLLHEVGKFQRLLNLEDDFTVAYWDQRGCGPTPLPGQTVSLPQQVDDLRQVMRWLHNETGQRVLVLGISWGATVVLQAVENEADHVSSVVAISPDLQTAGNDAAAHAFLEELALRGDDGRLRRKVAKLGPPPYADLAGLQGRARILMDLGTIERKKNFIGLIRELVVDLVRTYGVIGGMRALPNMNAVQRSLLPAMVALDFLACPPRITVPVHYVFGEQDVLTRLSAVTTLPSAIAPPNSTVHRVADAGHMVHFDQPHIVRSILENA